MRMVTMPDDARFIAEVTAESTGWLPLVEGACLHLENSALHGTSVPILQVAGVTHASMADRNVLWLG